MGRGKRGKSRVTPGDGLMRRWLVPAAVLTATLTVAACARTNSSPASAGSPSARPGTGASTSAPPARASGALSCAKAPTAMVSADLGEPVSDVDQTIGPGGTVVVCLYNATVGDPGTPLTIRIEDDTNASTFAEGRAGFVSMSGPVTDVPNFEDQAFTSVQKNGGTHTFTVLVARKGALEIEVSSIASLAREETLETQLFNGF